MAIPDAVRATVLLRLRQLGRIQRAVVVRASVIGRRFDLSVLVATSTCPERAVRAALAQACELQLVILDEPDQERYAFRHALTREIVYAEFRAALARPLHRRIARALERTEDASVRLEGLAFHFWAAGDALRALHYNELAGDQAAAVHASDDARTYYARARSLLDVDVPAYVRLTAKLRALGEPDPLPAAPEVG